MEQTKMSLDKCAICIFFGCSITIFIWFGKLLRYKIRCTKPTERKHYSRKLGYQGLSKHSLRTMIEVYRIKRIDEKRMNNSDLKGHGGLKWHSELKLQTCILLK